MLKSFASRRYAKTIREARGYLRCGDSEMYKACKSMLPVVAFCGLFENGHSKADLIRYNHIVIIDIDHLSEEALPTVAQQLQQDEYVFAYWKSPSGAGLKGLVRISDDKLPIDEHHRMAFCQLTVHFKNKYDIDIDQSGSDYSRLCYACWDEGLVIKETAKVFHVKHDSANNGIQDIKSSATVKRNKRHVQKGNDRQEDIDTLRDIIRYLRSTGRSITHEYENWLRVAYALASTFGPKTGETFFLLLSQQDADKFDPDACRQLLDYCYEHNNGQVSLGTIVYLAQKEGYRKKITFEEMTASDFLDAILAGGERADEAMYYLLHERLNKQLKGKFVVYQHQLMDEFEDVVEDFFLYLREGKDGRSRTPYQSIHRIQKKESFESWMLSTFRNYLTVRAAKEDNRTICLSDNQNIPASENPNLLTDERKLAIVSHLISFAHQVFYPRSRFIFLRSLLTMLNKQQALPNEEMAKALGMTDISYRVSVHRMKCRLAKYRTLLLQGEQLTLDAPHRQMAQRINDDFGHLYPTLMLYYGQTLDILSHADAVKQLRQEYLAATGTLLHEPELPYSLAPSISSFWTRLERFLIV
ncbi:MAG: BT4734/BF3469 family protein [bacterium]